MDDSDQVLAKRIVAGNKKAFHSFYYKYQPRLLSYVMVRVKTKEDAEEIVQDAFMGFLDSLPLFNFNSSLWTFLVSITRHEISDYYRKLYAKKAIRYVPFLNQIYSEPMLSMNETRYFFDQALKKIDKAEKQIILWKYEEKLSVEEIAEKLGTTIKATESRLFRARKAFQMAYLSIQEQD